MNSFETALLKPDVNDLVCFKFKHCFFQNCLMLSLSQKKNSAPKYQACVVFTGNAFGINTQSNGTDVIVKFYVNSIVYFINTLDTFC